MALINEKRTKPQNGLGNDRKTDAPSSLISAENVESDTRLDPTGSITITQDDPLQTFGIIYSGIKPLSLIPVSDLIPTPSPESASTPLPVSSDSPSSPSAEAPASGLPADNSEEVFSAPQNSNDNGRGLVAGLAVLAVLLFISIAGTLWVLFRKRRRARNEEYMVGAPMVPPKRLWDHSRGSSVSSLEISVAKLENQLKDKDEELRSAKTALDAKKRTSLIDLSDTQIRIRFAKIEDEISDWVSSGFESFSPTSYPTADLTSQLQRVSPDYEALLIDPGMRPLVVRALVADIIAQAFITEQFLNDVSYAEFKNTMMATSSAADFNEWRALTVGVLSKTESFQSERASTVEDIAKKIHHLILSLTNVKRLKKHLSHLEYIVEEAASLALDLAKQRALIKVERPGAGLETFSGERMEDVTASNEDTDYEKQGEISGGAANGRQVRLWVFPTVVRYGNDEGHGYETGEVVCKAKVLPA